MMFAWLAKIGIGGIVSKIADAYKAKADAQTDQERIAADVRIKTLEARRDVMVAESGSRLNSIARALLAAPVMVILWKVLVWDKALGQWTHGTTDALSPELWDVISIVIGFYFLSEGAIGVARIFKRK